MHTNIGVILYPKYLTIVTEALANQNGHVLFLVGMASPVLMSSVTILRKVTVVR